MQIDFDPNIDYYKALGVSSTATLDEIKKAYRKLAKQNHPDSTGGDKAKEARFKEIGAAYDVLGDAKKRKQYDEIRAMGGMRGRGGGPGGMAGMSGFPGGGGMGGMSGHGQAWDLGDLFAQMFSQQAGGAGGGRRSVRFERGDDDDNGWVFETRQGDRPPSQNDAFEGRTQASDGSWLTVKGKDVHSDVHIPFGDAILGTIAEVATLDGKSSVKIPPGTGSGKKLRLRGKGVLTGDGAAGDHYVTVQIDVPANLDDKAKKLLVELTTHLQSSSGGSRRK